MTLMGKSIKKKLFLKNNTGIGLEVIQAITTALLRIGKI